MNLKNLALNRQTIIVLLVTGIAVVISNNWIEENSGLKCENCHYVEIARQLADACITLALGILYGSVALYACNRWNKYNRWKEARENKSDDWNKPPENDTDKDTKGT